MYYAIKKVVMIHGQNHEGSSCNIGRILVNKFDNCEVKEFFLPRALDHFCLGCYKCIEDESRCPFYMEKKQIMDAVEEADFLVFTTPTYCMRTSAPMKSFLDMTFTYWMIHKPRKCMFGKKAVVISTAAGAGAKSATKDISNALFYWGVPEVKRYGIAVQAMSWSEVSQKRKTEIDIEMTNLAKRLQRDKVCVGIKTKAVFMGMRMMQLKNWGAGEAEKEYWERQGWLGSERPWGKTNGK